MLYGGIDIETAKLEKSTCRNEAIAEAFHYMHLVYIDAVVAELIAALGGNAHRDEKGYCYAPVEHTATLGEIVDLIYSFRASREERSVPDMTEDSFPSIFPSRGLQREITGIIQRMKNLSWSVEKH